MLELDRYLDALKAAKQWGLHALMKDLDAEQRATFARRCVSAAVANKDEETAIQQLELLKLAFDDVQAVTLRKVFQSDPTFRDQMYRLQEQSCAQFAAEAVGLWMETPPEQEAPFRPGENRITRVPTLVEYKRKLVELIIQRWHITDDASEADSFLDVIIAVMKRDFGAYDFITLAIRETKESPRHRDRVLRGILRMIAETGEGYKEDPAKSFWLGLARNLKRAEVSALGQILRHLPLGNLHQCWAGGYPAKPLLDAVARETEALRKMHDVVCELRAALKPSNGKVLNLSVEYPHRGQVWMTITLSEVSPDLIPVAELEKLFRVTAENLSRQAKRWLKKREAEKGDAPMVRLTIALAGLTLSHAFEIG